MRIDETMQLAADALWLVALLSAPAVLIAVAAGLLVAVVQSATQLQEQTIQFAVKLAAVAAVLLVTAGLMGSQILRFTESSWAKIATIRAP